MHNAFLFSVSRELVDSDSEVIDKLITYGLIVGDADRRYHIFSTPESV